MAIFRQGMVTVAAEVFQTATIGRRITGEVLATTAHRLGTTAIAVATLATTVVADGIKPAHRN